MRISLPNALSRAWGKGSSMAYSALANPRATRAVLDRFGLSAKHALGQNFLIEDNVIGNILHFAGLDGGQAQDELPTVLEIGPGIGTLSVAMLEYAHVVAVERDRDLLEVLAETTSTRADRFSLIHGDALKLSREELDATLAKMDAPLPHQLVSNLPYAIAATVVLDWLERFEFLDAMTVMVQSEVADRMNAQVGTKNYGAYTVKLRLIAKVTDRFQVSRNCFMPAPHVESAVVHIERNSDGMDEELKKAACKLADAAFAQRRKNIRNSMQSAYERDVVDGLLEACDIPPTIRGEKLGPEQFVEMARVLLQMS